MLQGSYHPRTDHLRFNERIPDEFPFISYQVCTTGQVSERAVLVEEFLHRCQWAGTPFGLLFRQAAMAQVRLSMSILNELAGDHRIRLPTPWFDPRSHAGVHLPERVVQHVERLRAVEVLQRFLLGVPLGHDTDGLAGAVDASREVLVELTPLRFGTFRSWSAHDVIYRADGKPITNRSSRGIMESHASAYAAELLRSSSPAAAPLIDDHIRRNRVGLYRALEELASATDTPVPALEPRHILELADVALSVQLFDIPGLPPPPDFLDSMLPYARYATALTDVHESAAALAFLVDREPQRLAGLTATQRLDLIVRTAATIRGQASSLFGSGSLPRREVMEHNVAGVLQWAAQQLPHCPPDSPVGIIERMVLDAIAYTSVRFFKIYAETNTDTVLFTPDVDRFVFLARYCDWPVIEYPDGFEVFLCDPMDDPQPVVGQSITVFEVTNLLRRLLVEACTNVRSRDWRLTLWQQPLVDLFDVAPAQLVPL